jgi:hypothetical protein
MRTRRALLVGVGFFLLGGCSLIANLDQFDGATEAVTDAGTDAQVQSGEGGTELYPEGDIDTSDQFSQDDEAAAPLGEEVAEETSSVDASNADASGDGGESGGADSAGDMDASPDPCGITSPNLLANPGFECGESPWYPLAANVPLEIVTSPTHSGAYACLEPSRTQTYDGPTQNIAGGLAPGILYRGSAWVQIGTTDGGVVSAPAYMTATFSCAETTDAGSQYVQVAAGTANSSGWTQISGGAVVVPSGCTPLNPGIYVEGPPPGIDLYVDDVSLSE